MSKKKSVKDQYPIVEKSKNLQNSGILPNIWEFPKKENFSESYKEFYSPDLWFIGKKREFENAIAKAIRDANELVIICSFLLQETEIIEAALSVCSKAKVYIITASENRLNSANRSDEGLEEEKIKDHLELLQKLKKRALIRTASNFHAKFVLIDPKHKNQRKGFLSTANLTQHALANNVEMGIGLNSRQIIDLFNLFCSVFWHRSEHELLTRSQLQITQSVPVQEIPEQVILQHIISPGTNLDFKSTLMKIISDVEGDIFLSAYSIEENNDVYALLLQELEQNPKRKISLFIRPREKVMPVLAKLKDAGAEIIGHSLLHMKALLIDNPAENSGLVFTGNLTEQSFSESFDIGLFLNSNQKQIIMSILKSWKSKYMMNYIGDKPIHNMTARRYQIWNPNKMKIDIKEQEIEDLGDVDGENLDNYTNFEPVLNFPQKYQDTVKNIKFIWRNNPPHLPSKAQTLENLPEKEFKRLPENLQKTLEQIKIYKLGNEKYIRLENNEDLNLIKEISHIINAKIVI